MIHLSRFHPLLGVMAFLGALLPSAARATDLGHAPGTPLAADASGLRFVFSDSTLTLAIVESLAVARNPGMQGAQADEREAGAAIDAAGAWPQPMTELMAAPRSWGSQVGASYRVQVEQPLPWFGPRTARQAAARADARAMTSEARAKRLDVLRDLRNAYAELWAATRINGVTRDLAAVLDAVRRSALTRYGSGLAEAQEPLMAQTEVAMLEHERIVTVRRIRVAQIQLLTLMHLPLTTPLPSPPAVLHDALRPDADYDYPFDNPSGDAAPEEASARARVTAREADVTAARRMGRPMLTVGAAYDRFMDESERRPAVILSTSLPIWRGGVRADAAMAQARLDRARFDLDALRDRLAFEIDEARTRLDTASHDLVQLDTGVLPLSERANRAAVRSYEAGRGEFSMVIESARTLLRARVQRIEAERMARMAHADLHRIWAAGSGAEEIER